MNVNAFSAAQLPEVVGLVLELLLDPKGSAFQERLGAFAQANSVNVPALRNVARGLIVFFKGAVKHNLQGPQVAEDCAALGISDAAAEVIRSKWEESFASLATAQVTKTIMANQVVDMEWKFGVTAASDEVAQVGSTFLHLKLVVDRGNGQREDIFMELSLPQFYQFMGDMEKAKTYIDFLSPS